MLHVFDKVLYCSVIFCYMDYLVNFDLTNNKDNNNYVGKKRNRELRHNEILN